MADAALKMGLHGSIRASSMRSDRAMALRAPQSTLSVACERLVYRDGVPSLVGPQLAVFNHRARMSRAGAALQGCECTLAALREFQADKLSDLACGCTSGKSH